MSDSMYAVISGELEVVNPLDETDPDMVAGAKQVINIIKTGDVVGEMGMIRSTERTATVVASEPSELLEINDRMIKRLQWLYPPTAQKFFVNLMTTVCDRLEDITQCYIDVTTLDDLTGLHNRTYFMDLLAKEMARSRRYKTPLSIVLMDLDNFRGVNHLWGLKAGDSILTDVGRLLKERVRISDL